MPLSQLLLESTLSNASIIGLNSFSLFRLMLLHRFIVNFQINLYCCSIAYLLKESGCEVPEYLLAIKKKSKKLIKEMAKRAPARDEITTVPIYDRVKGSKK